MEYGIIKKEIIGKVGNYTELKALDGYCFYDVDAEERNYLTGIATPITNASELERKFKVVYGNADELNENLAKESEILNLKEEFNND